jgi:DNA-binding PadR family transcriptional regulator
MSATVAYTPCHVSKSSNTKKDRRSRQDLEIFILALISEGASTPYDLMASAKISPGASLPALRRLEKAGYVRKGVEGPRNRAEYASTAKGERLLEASWRELFEAAPSADKDLDTVLRISSLALLMGETKLRVVTYLTAAASARLGSAALEKPVPLPRSKDDVGAFAWMRTAAKAGRMRQEAAVLKKLAGSLRRMK